MKQETPMYCTGLVILNSDTAIGRTRPVVPGEQPNRFWALSTIAGSVASEDCVLAAITCAGSIPAANCRRRCPPASTATTYRPAVTARYNVHMARMYQPSALRMLTPALTHT